VPEPVLLAADLGTTTLAGRLLSASGTLRAEAEVENPQKAFGSDVVRRLDAAKAGHGGDLQRLLSGGVNQLVETLLEQSGCQRAQICAAAVAANPAVTHLLTAEPVDPILFPPHRPKQLWGERVDASCFGVDLPVPLYIFPLLSGYVGGDLLAVLLAADVSAGEPALYIDLGTNAELALWDGQRWLATSVAAGPAFEAAHLSCGISCRPGAVHAVRCCADHFALDVVGRTPPLGLCGSGFFSAIRCGVLTGLIDRRGQLRRAADVETLHARYLIETDDGPAFQLYRDAHRQILIRQSDIRAFQLAKGAVAAGVDCLLERAHLSASQVQNVTLSGALGATLDGPDLKEVALLPEVMLDKVRFVPSAVLDGVQAFLLAAEGEAWVRRLLMQVKPFPLSGTPSFERRFLQSLDFS